MSAIVIKSTNYKEDKYKNYNYRKIPSIIKNML